MILLYCLGGFDITTRTTDWAAPTDRTYCTSYASCTAGRARGTSASPPARRSGGSHPQTLDDCSECGTRAPWRNASRERPRRRGIGRARPLPAQTTDRPTAFTVDLVFERRQKNNRNICRGNLYLQIICSDDSYKMYIIHPSARISYTARDWIVKQYIMCDKPLNLLRFSSYPRFDLREDVVVPVPSPLAVGSSGSNPRRSL